MYLGRNQGSSKFEKYRFGGKLFGQRNIFHFSRTVGRERKRDDYKFNRKQKIDFWEERTTYCEEVLQTRS